jgi:DNA-binding transcriptional ArsR family regulator
MIATIGPDLALSEIAATIAEPARARMLCCLLDGRARTSTELAVIAGVTPSTASVHLQRLKTHGLTRVLAQGKHRYYSLQGADVAMALEALNVLAGGTRTAFVPSTPSGLRAARTCYDHIAGTLGVSLHDRFQALGWLSSESRSGSDSRDVTPRGAKAFAALGVDIEKTRALRRRFAYACLDWSERRPHLGGALAAAVLNLALRRKWMLQDLDSRALRVTTFGKREMATRFGLHL